MKIVTIIGARPQFIKAAALSRALRGINGVKEIIVHTGQHYDKNMSDVFFTQMDIPRPNYNLNVNNLGHAAMTGRMLEKIETILLTEMPDYVLVFGDTNSTLAGALAAQKIHIPVAHVEAGLRSFNMKMPEEVNRILTDRISQFLFCPTQTAVKNLEDESFERFDANIHLVGDVMYDAALFYEKKSDKVSQIIQQLGLSEGEYALCTVHRQENTDNPYRLKAIFSALEKINGQKKVIVPLHPRTRKILEKNNIKSGITFIEPIGYFDIIQLIKHSALVLTDSGGMQKEAFFFNKYCLTLRDETEWVELVQNNVNRLCGANENSIIENFLELSGIKFQHGITLYGTGNACQKITNVLTLH